MRDQPHPPRPPHSPAARVAIALIRFYQYTLSPLKMGSTCRFEPTCSAYALHAVTHSGFIKGVTLTLVRIITCGPWHPGGYDPPPGWNPTPPTATASPEEN